MRVVRGEGADVEKLTVGADWVISHDTERGVVQEHIDGVVRHGRVSSRSTWTTGGL